ncbi:PAS domain S-box-containing protein [Algoriphagus boseongensis]|uniref:histidine kinase n=1 Tax=Algoriphagus boseongensis TaxID=1442587 RepID=A0A4R6T6G0_9BACT|nr:ATP-binding protein [Algoriphagus boseongensis]TDQ18550.1 PAS domain S-box-containing protein [Algoriphagus boseongensis]
MQDRGINSTFKKIIYESSEMVFLADDTYPYSIFYGNESFENQIGDNLKERTLVGLGLDITSYIFKEELILTHENKDYSFQLELPQESGSNYYLFYKGKEVKTHGLPSKKEAYKFFTSELDLIAIGKNDCLTYVNPLVSPVLGYSPEEILNTNLCPFISDEDLPEIQHLWKSLKENQRNVIHTIRFKSKSGEYKSLECSIRFELEVFFVIARDVTQKLKEQSEFAKRENLLTSSKNSSAPIKWNFYAVRKEFELENPNQVSQDFYNQSGLSQEALTTELTNSLENLLKKSTDLESGFSEKIQFKGGCTIEISGFKSSLEPNKYIGIFSENSSFIKLSKEIKLHKSLWLESPEAMVVVDEEGNIMFSNKEALELFGLEKLESLAHLSDLNVFFEEGENWTDWVKAYGQEKFVTRFSTLLINEKGKQLTLEVATKKSTVDGDNFVVISFRNISERIILEKTLEESGDFLMNLTEQVPGGLYQLVLNSEGQMNFSFLSKGINSVLGLSQEEILEFKDISVAISKVHPQDLPQVIMSSVASARKLEPWQCQFRVKSGNPDQPYRWVLGAARPQSLENGDMVWYGYLTDITKQKEFETKLDEARKTAEKANQIKSDFLSMISHELRTPLNAISGSVYSLFQENPTENQKTALTTINFAVDNLIIMINDLLDFQKIEAGKLTIEKNPFNLQDLLDQIVKGLSFHAKDSQNILELHVSEGLNTFVKGDKTRLSQVLNNLITNALKFTNKGNVDIKVELVAQSKNKIKVYFEVKDTGIGIAPENQEKIFNDFDQVRPTFSTKYGGTGLGLSITRKLLGLMGGNIALESEVGKGSKFYFELEFEVAQEEQKTPAEISSSSPSYEGLHLLMAEDNDVNALVLGKIIKKWGYTFDRAVNGLEAVEAAKNRNYDCILMDIQMPEMDGFEATVAIKKFSDRPVIALTAAAKLEIMEKIQECGFDGFVAKPIDAAELLKRIKEVISEKNQRS